MMCCNKPVLLLSVLSFAISVCSDQLAEYRRHEALLKQYPCGTPQPRVFELEEIIGEDVLRERTSGNYHLIKPSVTVLHRCYSSGCCKYLFEKCMPSEEEKVKLTFSISSGGILDYLEVEAVNHTQCVCSSQN